MLLVFDIILITLASQVNVDAKWLMQHNRDQYKLEQNMNVYLRLCQLTWVKTIFLYVSCTSHYLKSFDISLPPTPLCILFVA